MLGLSPVLEALQQEAQRPSLRTEGVDPCMQALFEAVSRMDNSDLAAQTTDVRPATADCLENITYHALIMSFLASRAKLASRGSNFDEEKARLMRIEYLQKTLDEHGLQWRPLGYAVRGLLFFKVSPVTLVSKGTTLYVACRGSKAAADFLADLDMKLLRIRGTPGVLHGDGRIHRNFLQAFTEQVAEVLDSIDKLVNNRRDEGLQVQDGVEQVVFCGHSLGGALAQLLGLAFGQRTSPATNGKRTLRARIISFGCPRLGNQGLTDLLREYTNHDRLYVHLDVIAGVPSPSNKDLLRLVPDVGCYAPHHANRSWTLSTLHPAKWSCADRPLVRSVLVCIFWCGRKRHRMTMYASSLKCHLSQCTQAIPVAVAPGGARVNVQLGGVRQGSVDAGAAPE